MQTILITGGTGLVGSALGTFLLEAGYRIMILSRDKRMDPAGEGVTHAFWDPLKNEIDDAAVLEADCIIHLAGENVGSGRWSRKKKQAIADSRVKGTRVIYNALSRLPHHVKTFVSASGTSYYGDQHGQFMVESDRPGRDFLAQVCGSWEREADQISNLGVRVVVLRTGLVLCRETGLLPALSGPLRFGIAPIPGNGDAWLSWIHLKDLVRIYGLSVSNQKMSGVYNAVSPFPVSLGQLVTDFARIAKGRFYIPLYVPAFFLKTFLGDKGQEILKSSRVSAEKLMRTGFEFSFPTIGNALEDLYNDRKEGSLSGQGTKK